MLIAILSLAFRLAPAEASVVANQPPNESEDEAESVENGLTITPWLALFGQVEFEWNRERLSPRGSGTRETVTESSATYQLGVHIRPLDPALVELVLEYDSATGQLRADEAFAAYEYGPWELRAGKFYTPFGRYSSEFVSGPILEFGETRAEGIETAYASSAPLAVSLMFYRGEAHRNGKHSNGIDWALSLEARPAEALTLGISYQSDLADADERLGTDHENRYVRKVDAAGLFLHWHSGPVVVTAEALSALEAFGATENDRDKPLAWNLELTHPLVSPKVNLTWRLEGSRELEDAPRLQTGIALNWQVSEPITIAVEYLHGRYARGLAGDDDAPLRHIDTIAASITFEF